MYSYLITELNVNSAITKPSHDEVLHFDPESANDGDTKYTVRGYAYAGGGRRINRVEVSLDDGKSWYLATIEYPEDRFRTVSHSDPTYGVVDLSERDTCFCWCFWSYDVPIRDFPAGGYISLRAMDEGMNSQPRDMYINATSMLNNWWFRVAVLRTEIGVRFVHPAPVGTKSPGWMEVCATGF